MNDCYGKYKSSWFFFTYSAKSLRLCVKNSSSPFGAAFHVGEISDGAFEFAFEVAHAEKAFDAREKFEFVDRFGEEVVGSGFDAAFDVAKLVEGGDHNDGDVAGFGVG